MSASIYGIEHISNCDILAALADPSVKMNDHQYNGDHLFEYCLAHGGFRKPDPDKESGEVCLWSGDYFDPWEVEYEGKTYAAYLLCYDDQTNEGWEERPVALVLLDSSVLRTAQPPVHNVLAADQPHGDPNDLPTDTQLNELARNTRCWRFAHSEHLDESIFESVVEVLTDGTRCLFCSTGCPVPDENAVSDAAPQKPVRSVYATLGDLFHTGKAVCRYIRSDENDQKLLSMLDAMPTDSLNPASDPINWKFEIE